MSFLNKLTRQSFIKQQTFKQSFSFTSKRYLTATPSIKPACKTNQRFYSTKPSFMAPSPQAFTWKSAVVLCMTAIGLVVYFRGEKEKLQALKAKREREKIKKLGRPNIGRPFTLLNANEGRLQTSEELMKDRFTLIYFGFTHCPDICPEELDKMSEVVDHMKEEWGENVITPVFITCDPLRDTEQVVKEYVQDFHPDLIGFTGPAEDLKKVARSYRVYSYTPPDVSVDDDYLVDHSIFFYLMDPHGNFVDCYARDTTVEEVYKSVKEYMNDYIESGGKLKIKKKD